MILCNVLWTIYTRHLGLHNHIPNKVSKHVDQRGSKEWGVGGVILAKLFLSVLKFEMFHKMNKKFKSKKLSILNSAIIVFVETRNELCRYK